ncbi:hypothetical protein PG987_016321 [Apiospora arundinis]
MELKIISRSDISRPDFSKYDKDRFARTGSHDKPREPDHVLPGASRDAYMLLIHWKFVISALISMPICITPFPRRWLSNTLSIVGLNITPETATSDLLMLLVDFVMVADYFLLDSECHVAVLERMRSCLSSGGTRRRWPEFIEAVKYAYGLQLADSETPRLIDARKVLVGWYNEKHETARKKLGSSAFSFLSQVPQFALDVLLARDKDEDEDE